MAWPSFEERVTRRYPSLERFLKFADDVDNGVHHPFDGDLDPFTVFHGWPRGQVVVHFHFWLGTGWPDIEGAPYCALLQGSDSSHFTVDDVAVNAVPGVEYGHARPQRE